MQIHSKEPANMHNKNTLTTNIGKVTTCENLTPVKPTIGETLTTDTGNATTDETLTTNTENATTNVNLTDKFDALQGK